MYDPNDDGHMDAWHMGWGWSPIWWLLGVALIAALAWALLRSRRGRAPRN
jgi:hypothetical protein